MQTLTTVIDALKMWQWARRDGGISHADLANIAARKLDDAAELVPALEAEFVALRKMVGDMVDVIEAHAVHGDHSPATLQAWADQGRRVLGDLPARMVDADASLQT